MNNARKRASRFTRYARPGFLYVIYAMILWGIPLSLLAAFIPGTAAAMADIMGRYLGAIPESLWALFGAAYLGYTAARQVGKIKGVE
jgi:VanZ family protein